MEACEAKTVADVARKLQVPHPTARNYVQEGRLPSAEILIRIADETNVSLDWLLLGEGHKTKSSIETASASIAELFEPLDRKVIQDIADAGGLSFEETVVHLVREALAMKGIGQMPDFMPVPVFQTMDDELFLRLSSLPAPERKAETERLIGKLVLQSVSPPQ